jgi:hypothetical protein
MNAEKTRGMALAYIDARDVQDRLNDVCGADWQTRHPWASGTLIACEIGIKVGGEWVWRGDGAGEIENETSGSGERKEQAQDMARKAAFSDSFKRAAVRWGVGRYLYDIDSPWVEIEARGRSFVIPDRELGRLRGMLSGKGALSSPDKTQPASASEGRTLSQIRDAIHRALSLASTIKIIDDILMVNQAELALIKSASELTFARLTAYAERRKAELAPAANGLALAGEVREALGQP